jgi:hypothetical protein
MDNQDPQGRPEKVKSEKVKIIRPEPDRFVSFLAGNFRDVLDGSKGMTEVEKILNSHVLEDLTEEEQLAWKSKAQDLARRVIQVAEGFSSVIVVLASKL